MKLPPHRVWFDWKPETACGGQYQGPSLWSTEHRASQPAPSLRDRTWLLRLRAVVAGFVVFVPLHPKPTKRPKLQHGVREGEVLKNRSRKMLPRSRLGSMRASPKSLNQNEPGFDGGCHESIRIMPAKTPNSKIVNQGDPLRSATTLSSCFLGAVKTVKSRNIQLFQSKRQILLFGLRTAF